MGNWAEVKGTRREENTLETRDYIVTFEILTASAAASAVTEGMTLADVATGTFGTTGLIGAAEPTVVQSSNIYRNSPIYSRITCRFRGIKVGP